MTVQFDRAMIDLVREIRRHVSSDLKPSIKLANPDLLYDLQAYYRQQSNTVVNTLIKELSSRAGEEWLARLEGEQNDHPRVVTRVYRGQAELVEVEPEAAPESSPVPKKSTRMYRGQPILD